MTRGFDVTFYNACVLLVYRYIFNCCRE